MTAANDAPPPASLHLQLNSMLNSKNTPTNKASDDGSYDAPESWRNLNEAAAANSENVAAQETGRQTNLEDLQRIDPHHYPPNVNEASSQHTISALATQIYTLSYLIFFSLLGVLARLGLTVLTTYHGAPVFPTVWANVGGSVIMGFLAEDRMLFQHEWGRGVYNEAIAQSQRAATETGPAVDLAAAKKAHLATKKTMPLYIGLATGFCGSFTSFSTFIRDAFLALSNDLTVPGSSGFTQSRNGGESFMALLAVIMTDVTLSLSAFHVGIHLAAAMEGITPSISFKLTRKVIDPAVVFLGWGCWIGAIIIAIVPPHDAWRGKTLFSLVFAPLGCLGRFYLAMYLNSRIPRFPLGTFAANIIGSVILGIAWNVAHIPAGGILTCQLMQGLEDGLCGCLTTVSTWVAELSTLKRRNAYIYGTTSVAVGLAAMIIIMGSLRWSEGFHPLVCQI